MNWCVSLLVVISCNSVFAKNSFPLEPDHKETPGTLCTDPDEYRYPEKIPYCKRDVSKSKKNQVIKVYENDLGFEILDLGRENFKIDHLIPLCAGGSNDDSNLWPQYKEIYAHTDPVEQILCEKMAAGMLLQKDAVVLILDMKHYRKSPEEVLNILNTLPKPKK